MADVEYTPFGRRADFIAPKPLPAREIKKLGDALDHAEVLISRAWHGDHGTYLLQPDTMTAERFYSFCDRRHHAELAYVRAVIARDRFTKWKAETATRPPKSSDAFALRDAMAAASDRLEIIEEAGEDFSTNRERIDARAAADLSEHLYEIAKLKFNEAERVAKITGERPRPARSSARLVTDGYVKTGRYKMVGGNRVPVLEKVE
jgi:hypothetical protein